MYKKDLLIVGHRYKNSFELNLRRLYSSGLHYVCIKIPRYICPHADNYSWEKSQIYHFNFCSFMQDKLLARDGQIMRHGQNRMHLPIWQGRYGLTRSTVKLFYFVGTKSHGLTMMDMFMDTSIGGLSYPPNTQN